GRRRKEELTELESELPSLDVTLRFTEGPDAKLRNINLSVDEWRVISVINPRHTIAKIAELNNMGEFQVRKIVSKLLHDGLVEIVGTATPKSRAPLFGHSPPAAPPPPEPERKVQAAKVGKSIIHRLIDRIRRL